MLSTFNKPQLKGSILLKKSFKAPLIEEFFEISFRGWNTVHRGQGEVNSSVQELTASCPSPQNLKVIYQVNEIIRNSWISVPLPRRDTHHIWNINPSGALIELQHTCGDPHWPFLFTICPYMVSCCSSFLIVSMPLISPGLPEVPPPPKVLSFEFSRYNVSAMK